MQSSDATRQKQSALLGLGGVVLLVGALRGHGALPKPEELVSSACVLGAALLAHQGADEQRGAVTGPLAAGMTCGLLGDIMLSNLLPLPSKAAVPLGMVTFGSGHLAYLRAFQALAKQRNLASATPLVIALVSYQALTALVWQRWLRNDDEPLLSYGALAYGVLLAAMAGTGTGLALHDRRRALLAVGGTLFVASDLLLGARLLRALRFRGHDNLIWLSYIVGQALIVWGASED